MKRPSPKQFARALFATCDRYHNGYMSRATWSKHMYVLWARIEQEGLKNEVTTLVTPRLEKSR